MMWQSIVAIILLLGLLVYLGWRWEDEERCKERDGRRLEKRAHAWEEIERVEFLYPLCEG